MLIELDNVIPDPLPKNIVESSKLWGKHFRVDTNSRVLVSAQSGMGKSTLLHLIYGLVQSARQYYLKFVKKLRKLCFTGEYPDPCLMTRKNQSVPRR